MHFAVIQKYIFSEYSCTFTLQSGQVQCARIQSQNYTNSATLHLLKPFSFVQKCINIKYGPRLDFTTAPLLLRTANALAWPLGILHLAQHIRNYCVPIIRAYLQLHICFLPHGTNWFADTSLDGLAFKCGLLSTHVFPKPQSNRFIDPFSFLFFFYPLLKLYKSPK